LLCREQKGATSELPRLLRDAYERLAGQIGAATFSYPDYLDGLPSIHWEREPFAVSCLPAGWNVVAVSVQRTPEAYVTLRAEAGRLQQEHGPDARVPFVAWDAVDPRIQREGDGSA
jgi:hypothetical protein